MEWCGRQRVRLGDKRGRDIVATVHNARELARMRADAVKPEVPGSYALGAKWPPRTEEEMFADVGDQMDKPATATAALQLVVDEVAAGLDPDEGLQKAARLEAVPKRRRPGGRAGAAAKKPRAARRAAAAAEAEYDASSGETSDDEEVVELDSSSGSDLEQPGGAEAQQRRTSTTARRPRRASQSALPLAPLRAVDDDEPEDITVPQGQLGAYMAAQDVGDRLEKAPADVTGSGLDTGKTAREAACCWRKQPECVESNTEEAVLYPCLKCRFYFHHKCAIRNNCEEDNSCGRAGCAA